VFTGQQAFIPEYAIGKKWSTRYRGTFGGSASNTFEAEIEFRVVAREQVSVPSGTFDAFRVEGEGWSRGSFGSVSLKPKYWIAAGVRRPVATELYRLNTTYRRVLSNERSELTAYTQQ